MDAYRTRTSAGTDFRSRLQGTNQDPPMICIGSTNPFTPTFVFLSVTVTSVTVDTEDMGDSIRGEWTLCALEPAAVVIEDLHGDHAAMI